MMSIFLALSAVLPRGSPMAPIVTQEYSSISRSILNGKGTDAERGTKADYDLTLDVQGQHQGIPQKHPRCRQISISEVLT
jgi:hypothetical protein